MRDISYHDFIVFDVMNRLPDISSRPMMSGWCIYSNGVPFSAIIGNQLYFKAKGQLADRLSSFGWTRFNYKKTSGKTVKMNYWRVPDEIIDNQEAFNELANEVLLFLRIKD